MDESDGSGGKLRIMEGTKEAKRNIYSNIQTGKRERCLEDTMFMQQKRGKLETRYRESAIMF